MEMISTGLSIVRRSEFHYLSLMADRSVPTSYCMIEAWVGDIYLTAIGVSINLPMKACAAHAFLGC